MLRQSPHWSQSLALTEVLPNPEERRRPNDSLDLHTFNDKVLQREHPCIVQREVSNYRRKVVLVRPNRKLYETVEEEALRAQIRLTRQQQQPPLFSSLRKQLPLRPSAQKSASRINVQPAKPKQRLKAMISETHLASREPHSGNGEVEFLSVEKIALIEAGKKSASVVGQVQERAGKQDRFLPCSQLIREINVIKEKFNIQRILTNHAQDQQESPSSSNFHKFISIKAYDKHAQLKLHPSSPPQLDLSTPASKEKSIQVIACKTQPSSTPCIKPKPIVKIKAMATQAGESVRHKQRKTFTVPFETYHYRDLLWKINFTNSLYVEVPLQYEQRLRAYVGRGNNSCMVASLISRRPWFVLTDRPDEANFMWTQLKHLPFFRKQQQQPEKLQPSIDSALAYQPLSLLTAADSQLYKAYLTNHSNVQQRSDERLASRAKAFKYSRAIKSGQIREQMMQNHLINNYVVGNKKALFHTMSSYFRQRGQEPFSHLPLTFHITSLEDPHYYDFLRYYHKRNREIARGQSGKHFNAWIVKPGQNSNRGNGIKVCLTLDEVRAALRVRQSYGDGTYRTYIVQAYIERPLLYCRRKLDLRHYVLMTCVNGTLKGYWYRDGYVRTTSSEYSLSGGEGSVHLTNDAVQKQLPEYGKYEKGNKLSYQQLSAYIDRIYPQKRGVFYDSIYPRMKELATHSLRAASAAIDPHKLTHNFELFGLDFMIDAELKVWLIEVNSNPCLELSCPLLTAIIPRLVENTLQLTLDAIFPPPMRACPRGQLYTRELEKENRFELVFDERVEGLQECPPEVLDSRLQEEEDDVFEDCGEDWDDA